MSQYQTAPVKTTGMPGGVPYIIGNEAAERFSYYGMKTILVVYMTKYLMGQDMSVDPGNWMYALFGDLIKPEELRYAFMSPEDGKGWYHMFSAANYFFPFFGALIADIFLGKYKTILSLSVVYCLGHLALAMDDTRTGLGLGLALIAIGSGGIKPCVSAHVGDQFGQTNKHLLPRIFSWFYFSINFGSFFSTLMTPVLLKVYGPHLAFGIPGVLMFIATVVFWMGRNKFIHIQPAGVKYLSQIFDREGLICMAKIFPIYVFVAVFWSLYDQTGSAWVLQAEKMDTVFLGHEWLESQVGAVNPILVLAFIPIFTYAIYPGIDKVFKLTPLRKVGIGFFLTVLSFLIAAYAQTLIDAGGRPNISWQLIAYAVLTAAEVCVSITCLEFSYTQAPKKMKSIIMAMYLGSVSAGNLFTALVNFYGADKLPGAQYYFFFSGVMFVAAVLFIPVAMWYKEQTYIQDESDAEPAAKEREPATA